MEGESWGGGVGVKEMGKEKGKKEREGGREREGERGREREGGRERGRDGEREGETTLAAQVAH